MTTGDWIVLVVLAGVAPVFYVVCAELERWRERRQARRRGGTIDVRKRGTS